MSLSLLWDEQSSFGHVLGWEVLVLGKQLL